jgi:antitoxin MazE
MLKKLSVVGNSLGLIIEKPILELLKFTKDTELEMTTDGQSLTIRPAKIKTKKERLRESTARMMAAHEETLKKLAK